MNCPDCQKEYPSQEKGKYQCVQCYVKFTVDQAGSVKIIPFFDEMHFQPILIMLGILGSVLVFAVDDSFMSFSDRLSYFGMFVLVTLGVYQGVNWLCHRYRKVDRFFRWGTTPFAVPDDDIPLKLE